MQMSSSCLHAMLNGHELPTAPIEGANHATAAYGEKCVGTVKNLT